MSLNALNHEILEAKEYCDPVRITPDFDDEDRTLRKDGHGDWHDVRGRIYVEDENGTFMECLW